MGCQERPTSFHHATVCTIAGLLLALLSGGAQAGDHPNVCDEPGEEPDVIVGDLVGLINHGLVNGVVGISFGTTSCNIGTCQLDWIANTNRHPVIGQNLFRLKDGRIEQIGQSWLKHGFGALQGPACSTECIPADFQHLGVNCSDPYSADLNGFQNGLGPKFEVNPSTGNFPFPATDLNETGDAIYKRLQAFEFELIPGNNPGARYFIEGQYITPDDASAGNGANNNSYREIEVTRPFGVILMEMLGETQREKAGIQAWRDADGSVVEQAVDVGNDGRFILSSKATLLESGLWQYEYAVHNLNSHRGAESFNVPVDPSINLSSVGFRDVRYHSGSPLETGLFTIGWETTGSLTWSHIPDTNNPLFWGTLYNFRFQADAAPDYQTASLGLYRPGTPVSAQATVLGPSLAPACNADNVCDAGEDCHTCLTDCSPGATLQYELPTEIENLRFSDKTTLEWDPFISALGVSPDYDVIRGTVGAFPVGSGAETCVAPATSELTAQDSQDPATDQGFFYIVRGRNSCGTGTLGFGERSERTTAVCP